MGSEAATVEDIEEMVEAHARAVYEASRELARASTGAKNGALLRAAEMLEERGQEIKEANARDLEQGERDGLSKAMLDRLLLDDKRIRGMAQGLEEVAALRDPIGGGRAMWRLPNGLEIVKLVVPIGGIGIVYESRPNVTIDAAGLCVKAGNAALLRGGSEAINSNVVLAEVFSAACEAEGLPKSSVEMIPVTDRAAVMAMLKMDRYLSLIVPRGGAGLIRTVAENSTIPTLKHDRGLCHIYVDEGADVDMSVSVVHNAKVQRPGVCNAVETLLVHEAIAPRALPAIAKDLQDAGVEIRGCPQTCEIVSGVEQAAEEDWDTEYLDLILSVKVVADMDAALEHIARYSSGLAEAIITQDYARAERFLKEVDSATVYVNASTRFTDGGQFGLGAEIGISTDKLHARGPMSVEELTSTKYVIRGSGQIRE